MPLLKIVFPIFAIILFGYILRWKNVVKIHWIHTLNAFVYYVSLPAIILASFWEINWYNQEVWKIVGLNLLGLVIFSAVLLLVLSLIKISNKLKAAIYVTALVGNTVYMGFPIAGGAFSPQLFPSVIAAATAHLAFGIIFGILVTEFLVVKSRRFSVYFKDFAKNPLMVALFLGILFSLIGLNGPVFEAIKKPLAMLGATASPVALFALGGFLHGKFSSRYFNLSLLVAALKLLVLPLFIIIVFNLLGIAPKATAIAVVLSSMPSAVTCFVIAEQYELEEAFVASSIVVSTLASLFSILVFLMFV
jgi:predicted permease